jgi:hypothetical protein
VTARRDRTVRGLDHPPGRMTLAWHTPPTTPVRASLRVVEEPDGHDGGEHWDTMLTRLTLGQTRHRLQDVVGTLERLVPTTEIPLDAALRHLRIALRELEVP